MGFEDVLNHLRNLLSVDVLDRNQVRLVGRQRFGHLVRIEDPQQALHRLSIDAAPLHQDRVQPLVRDDHYRADAPPPTEGAGAEQVLKLFGHHDRAGVLQLKDADVAAHRARTRQQRPQQLLELVQRLRIVGDDGDRALAEHHVDRRKRRGRLGLALGRFRGFPRRGLLVGLLLRLLL